MTYPQWWERLVAAIIDGLIVGIPVGIVTGILFSIAGTSGFLLFVMSLIGAALMGGAMLVYKVYFEGGDSQATIGKKVFGLKVVTDSGGRGDRNTLIVRAWPWYLAAVNILALYVPAVGWLLNLAVLVLAVIAAVTFFLSPVGRCLQDTMTKMHVIKAGEGMIKTT